MCKGPGAVAWLVQLRKSEEASVAIAGSEAKEEKMRSEAKAG